MKLFLYFLFIYSVYCQNIEVNLYLDKDITSENEIVTLFNKVIDIYTLSDIYFNIYIKNIDYIDVDNSIDSNVTSMNKLLNKFSDFSDKTNSDIQILFINRYIERSKQVAGIAYTISLCTTFSQIVINLDTKLTLQPYVLAHEIAHILGCYHDETNYNIMKSTISLDYGPLKFNKMCSTEIKNNLKNTCTTNIPKEYIYLINNTTIFVLNNILNFIVIIISLVLLV